MNKHSRKYGLMWLSSYSPGDGSVDFVWVLNSDRNGECLSETVTESDISEWMRTEGQVGKWDGWDIVTIGRGWRHLPAMNRLAKTAVRPFHSRQKLLMGDDVYEYVYHGPEDPPAVHTNGNTDVYWAKAKSRASRCTKVSDGNALSVLFFLNHEKDFEQSGFQTRNKSKEMVPA
jgi:hypothetical protein